MNSKENRIFWLDMSRVIAIAGVVLIHAIVPLLYDYDKKAAPGWWVGNISDSPVRMSVPIFVMITGALLLKHEDNPIPFLWKKLPKLIIPLLVWGTIYKYFRPETLPTISFFQAFLEIIQGQAHFHFWFMYMIIGLYFSIPVFQFLLNMRQKRSYIILFVYGS